MHARYLPENDGECTNDIYCLCR